MYQRSLLLPLLFGIFSMTQIRVIGSVGISELFCYFAAPFVCFRNSNALRRDGFRPIIWLSICAILGCCLSSWHNHTIFPAFMRGLATTYSLFALPVCLHGILRNNLNGLKWILLGFCISMVVNVFVFQQAVEVSSVQDVNAAESTQVIMSKPLFWLQRIGGFLTLPVSGWYLNTPTLYAVVAPLIMVLHTLVTTDSGRSAFASALGAVALLMIGRKKVSSMRSLQRHAVMIIIGIGTLLLLSTYAYKTLASKGYLNEKAMKKYEGQSKRGDNVVALLMSGRAEFFVGLFAAWDNPIWGCGPWARDENGVYEDFLLKYGDYEDFMKYMKSRQDAALRGHGAHMLPTHSHIVGFWAYYGILALPFWPYVLWCMWRHFRHNMAAIPQWYGYFALALPLYAWHIFFSPYGNRVEDCLFITCLLLADSVSKGRCQLPSSMVNELMSKRVVGL